MYSPCSPVGGDKNPPTMSQLCEEILPSTNKWKPIAIQLEIDPTDIERISIDKSSEQERFMEVFVIWKRQNRRPFTWGVLVSVLKSRSVDELCLAENITKRYCAS